MLFLPVFILIYRLSFGYLSSIFTIIVIIFLVTFIARFYRSLLFYGFIVRSSRRSLYLIIIDRSSLFYRSSLYVTFSLVLLSFIAHFIRSSLIVYSFIVRSSLTLSYLSLAFIARSYLCYFAFRSSLISFALLLFVIIRSSLFYRSSLLLLMVLLSSLYRSLIVRFSLYVYRSSLCSSLYRYNYYSLFARPNLLVHRSFHSLFSLSLAFDLPFSFYRSP